MVVKDQRLFQAINEDGFDRAEANLGLRSPLMS